MATPLATAAYHGDIAVLEALTSREADLILEESIGAMHPRAHGGIPVMKFLIDHSFDVNAFSKQGGYTSTLGCKVERQRKSETLA